MIRTQEMVPDYYIENSRDFQVLCRLMDYTYNSVRYNSDTMCHVNETKFAKDTILPLIGDKFGIYDKQSYSNRELLSALPNSLYYKGALKSISILLNAYLDSLNIFDYALAYHSKDETSAKEISQILGRNIQPYTIVIVLSISPSLIELHVLDEYLKMVLPCGMLIDYVFGIQQTILDKFKYNENVFVYYDKNNYTSKLATKSKQYKLSDAQIEQTKDIEFINHVIAGFDVNTFGVAHVTNIAEEEGE